jgi:hypothetical protein
MQAYTENNRNALSRDMGLTGQLVVGGTVSTGLLLGGYAVAILTLAGRMNGNAVLLTSLGLFLVGALAGLALSVAAGLAGRDDGVSLAEAGHQVAKGVLYAIPATMIGAMLAGWIGMAVVGVYVGKVAPLVGSAVAAVIAAVVMLATARLTWESAMNVARRVRQAA